MRQLRQLCSPEMPEGRISSVRKILGADVEKYGLEIVRMLKTQDKDTITLYGCFAARKVLEAGCTALLSKIDPLRLLILQQFQINGKYDLGERHAASIDWKTDILSDKGAKWDDGVSPEKFGRALLGGHGAEVVWLRAIGSLESLPDNISGRSIWINELVEQFELRLVQNQSSSNPSIQVAAGMLTGFRQSAQRLFSTLSKGVHLEFIIDSEHIFDFGTIAKNISETLKLLTQLGFLIHASDCANLGQDLDAAIALVIEIEGELNGYA